ncbi:HAUS augmin-like complex subunit 6 N-terminus-domain-containing protein [Fennellomyces sp. T-0311]|nr:HAUS augmin-like complex subunit 6 N-terminus-domain-containing protein [Fennellomyces sp. T-0311]
MAAPMFLQNLQLLGFDNDKHAKGVFKKIVFDEQMFMHANNNKAFESTSHFLFAKLDPTRARKEFTKCWPMTETEYWRQSREYRSIAYRWLDELRLKCCLPGQITLRKSLFEDCRGDKITAIMFALSTYVLQTEVDRRTVARPEDHPPIRILGNTSVHMLPKDQLSTKLKSEIHRMSTAMTASRAMYTSNETWAKAARSMTNVSDDARCTSTMEENIQRVKDYVTQVALSKRTSNKKRSPENRIEPVTTKRTRTMETRPANSPEPAHSPKPIRSEPSPKPSPARTPSRTSIDEPDNNQAFSPLSYLSEKVSPVSNSFGDYCHQVVNDMLEQFYDQRTPEKALSPVIENRSARHSFASQPNWYRPSPLSQKLSPQNATDYDDELDSVYQNSPTRRASPIRTRHSRIAGSPARSSPVSRRLVEQSPAPSPAASSLHAYRAAIEAHSELGLLDETEPDHFYNSDFASPAQ